MEVVGTCPVLYVVVRVQRGDDEMQASLDNQAENAQESEQGSLPDGEHGGCK